MKTKKKFLLGLMLACAGMLLMTTLSGAQDEFKGKIAKSFEESVED